MKLTNYWLIDLDEPMTWAPYLADHPGERPIRLTGGNSIILPEAFLAAVQMEGAGLCHTGTLCYDGGGWELMPRDRFPWGVDARGLGLVPFRSIAVDRGLIPLGSRWRIPELVGTVKTPDGLPWAGVVEASDTGGDIVGWHVDLFVGLMRDRIDGATPDLVTLERIA